MSAKAIIIGKVLEVRPVETVGEKGFQKRVLVIDDSRKFQDGSERQNLVPVEFTGERMAQLDNFQQGMLVQVEGFVEGRQWNDRIFVNLRGWTIMPYQSPNVQPKAPAQYNPNNTEPYNPIPQETQYPTMPGFSEFQAEGDVDELPF